MSSIQARVLTIPQEVDLARRSLRGDAAYQALAAQGIAPPSMVTDERNLPNVVLNLSTIGSHIIIPAVAGQAIEVFALFLWSVADQTWEFLDNTSSLTGPIGSWPAQTGLLWPYTGEPYIETRTGGALTLSISAAAQVSGFLKYRHK